MHYVAATSSQEITGVYVIVAGMELESSTLTSLLALVRRLKSFQHSLLSRLFVLAVNVC